MEIIAWAIIGFIVFLAWSAIVSKDWNFLIGLCGIFIVPLTIHLISRYPVIAFFVSYVVWFSLFLSTRISDDKEGKTPEPIGNIAWEAAKYACATVIISVVISAVLGGLGSEGNCSRASPQYC